MSDTADHVLAIATLAMLPPMEYDAIRQAEAKRLGIRASTLDREVEKARAALEDKAKATGGGIFHEVEPWPTPVQTAALLDEITANVKRYVVLTEAQAVAVALWIAHGPVFAQFQHTPRLAVLSPTKRCGKSTLLDLLEDLSPRGLKTDNATASAIFRVVEAHQPTLLLDEADAYLADREELRGILNSGFEARGRVLRTEERDGEFVATPFRTFAPVALGAIANTKEGGRAIPATIMDRAIRIMLQRRRQGESVEKMRLPANRKARAVLRRKIARWAADVVSDLNLEPAVPEALNDRQGDISVPLLSIADHAGEEWGARARKALLEVFGADAEDDEAETAAALLTDIRAAFADKGTDGRISSEDMCCFLCGLDDRPWSEFNERRNPKFITARQVADLLRPHGIRPRPLRISGAVEKGYALRDFADAFARYLSPSESGYAVTSEGTLGVEVDFPSVTKSAVSCDVTDGESLKAAENLACNGVTAEYPPDSAGSGQSPGLEAAWAELADAVAENALAVITENASLHRAWGDLAEAVTENAETRRASMGPSQGGGVAGGAEPQLSTPAPELNPHAP